MTLDRVHPVETTHHVKVEHDLTPSAQQTAEIMARIEALAAKFNVALPSPKIIDGEAA